MKNRIRLIKYIFNA